MTGKSGLTRRASANVKDSFARPDDRTAPYRPADEGSQSHSLRRAVSEWQSQATVMTSLGFDRGLECNCVGYFCALLKEKACSCSLRCMRLLAFVSDVSAIQAISRCHLLFAVWHHYCLRTYCLAAAHSSSCCNRSRASPSPLMLIDSDAKAHHRGYHQLGLPPATLWPPSTAVCASATVAFRRYCSDEGVDRNRRRNPAPSSHQHIVLHQTDEGCSCGDDGRDPGQGTAASGRKQVVAAKGTWDGRCRGRRAGGSW